MPIKDHDLRQALLNTAPAVRGYTDADRAELLEIAARISERDFGHGLSKIETIGGAESMIKFAIAERDTERANRTLGPAFDPAVLNIKLAAKNTFGKRAVSAGNPAERRGAFVKEFGVDAYQEHKKLWGCTDDVKVPGVNPDRGNKKLKRALRELTSGTVEETTDFNLAVGHRTALDVEREKADKRKGPRGETGSKSTNPYLWPADHPGRMAAIAKIMSRMPTKFVAELAKAASCSISGAKITPKA